MILNRTRYLPLRCPHPGPGPPSSVGVLRRAGRIDENERAGTLEEERRIGAGASSLCRDRRCHSAWATHFPIRHQHAPGRPCRGPAVVSSLYFW